MLKINKINSQIAKFLPASPPPCPHAIFFYFCIALKMYEMKKLTIFFLPLLALFACQSRQEPAKTVAVPDTVSKPQTLVVNEEKPVPAQGLRDVNPPSDDLKNASINFRRGMELVKEKKYDEGIDYFNRALASESKNSRIYFNRGYAYFSKKDYDNAQADFSSALQINPSDTMALLYSGLTKFYKKDLNGALKDYSAAIEKSKRYSTAYFNRGLIKGQLHDYKGAIADFTQAIIFNPEYSQAYYNRGLAYFFNKDSNNACMDWIQAMRMGAPDAQKAVDTYCEKYKDWIK